MGDFKKRSKEKEFMDSYKGTTEALDIILQDINRVNRLLGGYTITLDAVFELLMTKNKKSYTILDMGCAEGTILRKLALEARKRHIGLRLIGVDLNTQGLELAKTYSKDFSEITYLECDILTADFSHLDIDVVMTTLTLHHLSDTDVVQFVKRFNQIASLGVVINDLQRSSIAYYLFTVFSLFFIKTEIAKKDGLLSIQRAFTKRELWAYAEKVKDTFHCIKWKWAFRYVWVLKKK